MDETFGQIDIDFEPRPAPSTISSLSSDHVKTFRARCLDYVSLQNLCTAMNWTMERVSTHAVAIFILIQLIRCPWVSNLKQDTIINLILNWDWELAMPNTAKQAECLRAGGILGLQLAKESSDLDWMSKFFLSDSELEVIRFIFDRTHFGTGNDG